MPDKNEEKKDEAHKAIKWAEKTSKVNAKTLSNKLPDIAAKLRDGSLRPDELAEQVADLSFNENMSNLETPKFRSKENPDVSMNIEDAQDMLVVKSVFINTINEDDDGATFQFYEDFKQTEGRFLCELPVMNKSKINFDEIGMKGMEVKQKGFEKVDDRWIQAGRISGRSLRRMRRNPFYKVSTIEFSQDKAIYPSIRSNNQI